MDLLKNNRDLSYQTIHNIHKTTSEEAVGKKGITHIECLLYNLHLIIYLRQNSYSIHHFLHFIFQVNRINSMRCTSQKMALYQCGTISRSAKGDGAGDLQLLHYEEQD